MVEAPSRQYRCKLRSGSFRNIKNDVSNSNKTLDSFELSKELSSTPRKGAALATDLGAERPGFEHLRERMGAAALLNSALCEKERHDFSVYQGRAGGQEGAGRQAGRTERPGHPADCRRSLRLMAQFSSVANIIFCPYPLLSSFHNCSLRELQPRSPCLRLRICDRFQKRAEKALHSIFKFAARVAGSVRVVSAMSIYQVTGNY
jgi:hypothetical protein